MSNNKEILDRIAKVKEKLHTNGENVEISGFNNKPKVAEKVKNFDGKVLSPMKEYVEVLSPSKSEMYAVEFGFSPLAKGQSENVQVDNYVMKNLPAYRSTNLASMLKDKGSRE